MYLSNYIIIVIDIYFIVAIVDGVLMAFIISSIISNTIILHCTSRQV